MIVSPSMSLVAAGVASGICFILLSSIRRGRNIDSRKKRKEFIPDDSRCACCLKPFLIGRGVQCSDCGVRSCRKGCSRWDTSDNAWHCLFCHQRRTWLRRNEKWFETFGGTFDEEELHRYFSTAKSRVYVAGVENAVASSSSDLATGGQEQTHTMETVRDFVEKIVENLIGNVNDTPIDRLYDHPAYKPSTDPPSMAHTALRELVERAVEEARKLPGLGGSSDNLANAQDGRNITDQSYEDLLATAILNKVIEKFQKEQVDGNSNVLTGKSSARSKYTLSESELGLDEGVEEGSSSLEPLSQDECSSDYSTPRTKHSRNRQEPLSLTIEERIEEVTTTYTSDEEHRDLSNEILSVGNARRVPFPEFGMDIVDPSQESSEESQDEPDRTTIRMDVLSPIETWEENWLFQKKRAQTQPDAVAMLVPNSTAEYKALIGDKDAEDTSDLSECSSAQSDEEIEKELMEAIDNVVPRSPKQSESEEVENFRKDGREEEIPSINKNEYIESAYRADCNNVNSRNALSKQNLITNGTVDETTALDDLNNPKNEIIEERTVAKTMTSSVEEEENCLTISKDNTGATKKSNENIKSDRSNERNMEECGLNDSTFDPQSQSCTTVVNSNLLSSERNVVSIEIVSPQVPKTPRSTPTRTSETEIGETNGDVRNFVVNDEKILNSLESAKKMLMAVEELEEDMKNNDSRSPANEFHVEEEIQQESEYTEHYDTVTQRCLESLTRPETLTRDDDSTKNDATHATEPFASLNSSSCQKDSKCREALASAKAESASLLGSKKTSANEDARLATPPRPGTIAEREHKKWENAPPIENNPYSEESLQKRLWERQYTRRSADIPGVHAELPKSNGTELEVNLEPHQPDIKRFGRDYYINESKTAHIEKARRTVTSQSSRPSSSLSQRSNSTTAEHEQQVSHGLERFEEASLRGSLSRWSYRDPRASPNFAINPLLRLDNLSESRELADEILSHETNDYSNKIDGIHSGRESIETSDIFCSNKAEGNVSLKNEVRVKDVTDFFPIVWRNSINSCLTEQSSSAINKNVIFDADKENVALNPLYDYEKRQPGLTEVSSPLDRDSGMDSIESNEIYNTKLKMEIDECTKRLSWIEDGGKKAKESQTLSINGKKYWNLGINKYHTFGGIRRSHSIETDFEDPEEDQVKTDVYDDPDRLDVPAFARFKFQTFGGIKRSQNLDGRKIPSYRAVKLRPPLQNVKGFKMSRSAQNECTNEKNIKHNKHNKANKANKDNNEYPISYDDNIAYGPILDYSKVRLHDDNWQDEEDTADYPPMSSHLGKFKQNKRKVPRTAESLLVSKRKKTTGQSRRRSYTKKSLSKAKQTEDQCSDDLMMTKFLSDVSKKSRSRRCNDTESICSLNTSKRKTLSLRNNTNIQFNQDDIGSDDGSLKLEPPIVPEVIEKRFQTLKELRHSKKNDSSKATSGRKLGVRSLSDVTIW